MEFKGYILDRKNKQIVIGGDENDMEDEEEFIPYVFFLKMVALSPDCKSDTTIAVSEDGNDFVIATLRPGKLDQTRSDLILPTGTVLKLVKGDGPLHVTGYLQEADDNEYEGYDDDEESEGESEEESELNPGARLVYYQKSDEEDDSDDEDFVGEEDDEEDDDDEEEEEVFNSRKRKKAIDVVKGAASTKKSYIGSAQERKDICENYLKSGGNMDVFFSHQMLSDVDDEKRYKKIISEEQKKGNLRKFTPEETRLITSQLMTEEVDLANVDDEDDEDEDEEDFDSDDSLEGFIVRDGEESDEDEEEEEDDDEEEEEEDSEDEKPKKRSKPKSKKKGEDNEEIEELVERITASPNVPKKLSKFTNFCKHTLKLEDDNVIKELWARQNE